MWLRNPCRSPVECIRGRFLITWLIVAIVLSVVLVAVIWPEWSDGSDLEDPMPDAVLGLALSLFMFSLPALRARRAGLAFGDLYAGSLSPGHLPRLALLALPMIGAAFLGMYVLYAPLSLEFPGAIQTWRFEDEVVLYSAGPPYPVLGNVLAFLAIVVAAPVVE
jgi:hypothetical protein